MDGLERIQADEPEVIAYTHKAWQDVQLLLEGQLPPEGEDYGPWALHMELLRWDFGIGGKEKVQEELMALLENDADGGPALPEPPVTPDGRLWREVLEERQAREERRAALLAKVDEQEERQWKRARARAAELEEKKLWPARRSQEKREKRTPMKEWTLTELAAEILWVLEGEDHSRTQISALFNGNVSAERLNDALDYLDLQGQARRKRVSSGGRPREVWTTWWEE